MVFERWFVGGSEVRDERKFVVDGALGEGFSWPFIGELRTLNQ